jgi:hypothetical protein
MTIRSTTRLTFRCSSSEVEQARRRAEREGVTLSVALRCLLADYAGRPDRGASISASTRRVFRYRLIQP